MKVARTPQKATVLRASTTSTTPSLIRRLIQYDLDDRDAGSNPGAVRCYPTIFPTSHQAAISIPKDGKQGRESNTAHVGNITKH